MLMENKGVLPEDSEKPEVYIVAMGAGSHDAAFALCISLRDAGVSCDVDHMARGVKPQFKYADKIGAKYVLTIGDDELKNGTAVIKRMSDGEKIEVELNAQSVINALKA